MSDTLMLWCWYESWHKISPLPSASAYLCKSSRFAFVTCGSLFICKLVHVVAWPLVNDRRNGGFHHKQRYFLSLSLWNRCLAKQKEAISHAKKITWECWYFAPGFVPSQARGLTVTTLGGRGLVGLVPGGTRSPSNAPPTAGTMYPSSIPPECLLQI